MQDLYTRVCDHMRCDALVAEGSGGPVSWAFRASPLELLAAENAARQRKGLKPLAGQEGHSEDWSYLLTDRQQKVLHTHQKRWMQEHGTDPAKDVCCTVDLSQSAERSSTRRSHSLATFRRNSSRIWSPSRRRWLLARERAACMGYPVYEDLAQAAEVPMDSALAAGPDYAIGNAMHVANLGCVLMTALLATGAGRS